MNETLAPARKTFALDAGHSYVRFWVRHLMMAKIHREFGQAVGKDVHLQIDAQLDRAAE